MAESSEQAPFDPERMIADIESFLRDEAMPPPLSPEHALDIIEGREADVKVVRALAEHGIDLQLGDKEALEDDFAHPDPDVLLLRYLASYLIPSATDAGQDDPGLLAETLAKISADRSLSHQSRAAFLEAAEAVVKPETFAEAIYILGTERILEETRQEEYRIAQGLTERHPLEVSIESVLIERGINPECDDFDQLIRRIALLCASISRGAPYRDYETKIKRAAAIVGLDAEALDSVVELFAPSNNPEEEK